MKRFNKNASRKSRLIKKCCGDRMTYKESMDIYVCEHCGRELKTIPRRNYSSQEYQPKPNSGVGTPPIGGNLKDA